MNPGGSRSYRKGLFFLMFHEDCLKYKKYGQTPQRMEYREFFERILDAFGDEQEEETMEEVTEAEHERTDSEPEREVEELAAEPQRVPKIMEDVTEIEKDVPEISENVIETEVKVTHQIKLVAEFFDDAAAGRKSFELRKNDRNYKEGDVLEMEEVKDGKKTGRKCSKRIVYMMENFEGLEDGYCILGCELL